MAEFLIRSPPPSKNLPKRIEQKRIMPKAAAKEQKEPEVTTNRILYDATAPQTFKFSLYQRGREIPISHTLSPVDDARFFQMSEEIERVAEKLKKITTGIFAPKEAVWDEHATDQTGYGDRADWKERVSQDDKVAIVNAYFSVEPDDEPEAEESEKELIYDFDALVDIPFWCYFGSAKLHGMIHRFREYTRPEKDEYLQIAAGQSVENALASAEKISKNEKLARLGRKLLKESEGYAPGTPVPAWHLAATTEWYFLREIARQGKF